MKLIAQMDMTKLEIETYIKLFEDHVEIKKPGPGGSTKKYLERSIPLSDIKRVDVKPAGGFLSTGYIQFVVKDEKERKGGFLSEQFRDYCLHFSRKYNDVAQTMKEYVEGHNNPSLEIE